MNLLVEGKHSRLSLCESSEKAANINATFAERKATICDYLRMRLGAGKSQLITILFARMRHIRPKFLGAFFDTNPAIDHHGNDLDARPHSVARLQLDRIFL